MGLTPSMKSIERSAKEKETKRHKTTPQKKEVIET